MNRRIVHNIKNKTTIVFGTSIFVLGTLTLANTQYKLTDVGLQYGCRTNKYKFSELMITCGASNYEEAMKSVCVGGDIKLLNMLKTKHEIKNSDELFLIACENGNYEVALYLMTLGVSNVEEGFKKICKRFNYTTFDEDIKKLMKDFDDITKINVVKENVVKENIVKENIVKNIVIDFVPNMNVLSYMTIATLSLILFVR